MIPSRGVCCITPIMAMYTGFLIILIPGILCPWYLESRLYFYLTGERWFLLHALSYLSSLSRLYELKFGLKIQQTFILIFRLLKSFVCSVLRLCVLWILTRKPAREANRSGAREFISHSDHILVSGVIHHVIHHLGYFSTHLRARGWAPCSCMAFRIVPR